MDKQIDSAQAMLELINKSEPVRLTKQLENGNIAIFQIVNPENVPAVTKLIRSTTDNKLMLATETAFRVAFYAFRSYLRKNI